MRPSGGCSPGPSGRPSSRSAARRRPSNIGLPRRAPRLGTSQAQTVAQVLRAAPHSLSQQEIADATAMRLSFGPNDATIIDTDAAILFDPEGEDVRDLIEFANTQLLEMRFLDRELDDALAPADATLLGRHWRR